MRIQKATPENLREAAGNLSKGDLQEFHCMKAGRDPVDVLVAGHSEHCYAILKGSLVVAVGGHHPEPNGCIWFVTTTVVETLKVAEKVRFYRLLKEHLSGLPNYAYSNFVSVDNAPHIRLLESLGATFQVGQVMSPAGFPFKQFWL